MPRTLVLTALLLGLTNVVVAQDYDAAGETQMLERINALRGEHQLSPVERLDALDTVARAHSIEMATSGRLAHVSTTTGTPEDRVRAAGVTPNRVTENVANHRDTLGAHAALLSSPAHRQNVLDPNVTHIGLGSVRTERGVFVTQVYAGLPAQEVAAASVETAPVLEEAPPAPSFELIPPFVERVMEEAADVAAPVLDALIADDTVVEEAAAPAAPVAPTTVPMTAPVAPPLSDAPPPPAPAASVSSPAVPGASLSPLAEQTLRGLVSVAQALLGAAN